MKKIKSLVSIVLVMLMVLSTMPLTAFAESLVDMNGETDKYIWSYTATSHTLYFNIKDEITGEDRVVADDWNNMLPTYYTQEDLDEFDDLPLDGSLIHKIIIGNNILALDYIMFSSDNYPNLKEVAFEENSILEYIADSQFQGSTIKTLELPQSVIGIDDYAFSYSSLTSITLPESVESTGRSIFYGCTALESADLSKTSITTIARYYFDGCTALKNVALPKGINVIDSFAFRNTAIPSFDFSGFSSISKLGIQLFKGSMLESVDLGGFTYISESMFAGCTKLTDVNLNGVKKICKSAFQNSAIKEFDLTGVEILENYAFDGCGALEKVNFSGVKTIGDYAFRNTGITSADLTNVETIGAYAFADCVALENVNFSGVKSIGGSAFRNTGIKSADLRNVETIEYYAFQDCQNLASINVEGVGEIGEKAFFNTAITSVVISGATMVYSSAFANCASLEKVEFNIEKQDLVDSKTFENCTNLTEVVLSPYVQEIWYDAFKGCSKLSNIEFQTTVDSEGKKIGLETIYSGVFDGTAVKNIKLPSTIKDYSFSDSAIESVDLSEVKLEYIPDGAFYGCKNLTTFNVPEGITYIGSEAFSDCTNLTSVTLPDSLLAIDYCAFNNCTSLTAIDIPENVVELGDGAFMDCTNLKNVTLPNSLTAIDEYAFQNCSSLEGIEIPENVSTLGVGAFSNCSSITSVNIPFDVTEIKDELFNECTSLEKVTAKAEITSIGSWAFYNTKISDLSFAKNVTTIGEGAFADCPLITSISGLTNLKTIGKQAFAGCTGLTTTGDLEGVTQIGDSAFEETGITTAYFPSTLTKAGSEIYKNSTDLQTAVINSDYMGSGAFSGSTNLETVYFGDECTKIPSSAFANSGVKTINFSENSSITSIGQSAFENCTSLSGEFIIPESVTTIGASAFSGCTGITNFNMPGETKTLTINKDAFTGCTAFEEFNTNRPVTFAANSMKTSSIKRLVLGGNNTKTFENFAFANSETLEYVKINGNVIIKDEVFYNIPTLTTLDITSSNVSFSGDNQFYNSGLEEFNVPSGMITIPEKAFLNSANLKKLTFENDCALTSIGANAFNGCDITGELVFPNKLTTISTGAFRGNTHLKKVVLPAATTSLGTYAFYNCPLETVVSLNAGTLSLSTNSIFYDDNGKFNKGTIMAPVTSNLKSVATTYHYTYVAITPDGEIIDEIQAKGTWANGEWIIKTNDFENYEFIISGEGEIDLSSFKDADGNSITIEQILSDNKLNTITIADGITAVPDRFLCFDETKNYNDALSKKINFINLAPSVKRIGAYAFYGVKLQSFTIPDTVKELGEYAFGNAYIYDLTIGSGIKSVTQYAFYNANLTTIHINDGVQRLEKACFQTKSNITNIYIPSSVKYIHSEGENSDQNAFSYKSNRMHIYGRKNTEAYYFATTHVGMYIHVVMDTSRNLTHPANYDASGKFNTTQGTDTGNWYYVAKTKTLYLKGSGMISAYHNFDCAYDVETVVFEYGLTGYSTYTQTVLEMTNPSYIYFPTSFTSLSKDYLRGCTNLKSLIIPDSVTSVDSNLMKDCESIRYIKFGGSMDMVPVEFCKNIKTLTTVDFNDGVTRIGAGAFENCTGLKEINLPYGIKTVDRNAFNKCVNVVKLKINEKLVNISSKSFGNLAYCEEIEVDSAELLNMIDVSSVSWFESFKNLGASTTGTTLRIGDDVTEANLRAFDSARITEIIIGDNVSSIKDITNLPYLQEVIVSDNNSNYYSWGGALYSNDNCLVLAPSQIDNLEIKPGTVKIGDYAFSNSFIDGISIPATVKEIGNFAFYNCIELETVDLPNSVTAIGESAFENCKSLRIFYSPSKLQTIGARAFANCTHLGTAVLSSNKLTTIDNEAFMGCTSLIGMVVPETVQAIGDRAYMNCPEMTEIYIWSAQIGTDTFKKDKKLTIFTMAGSDAYRYAREYNVDYSAYTDEDMFFDLCADKTIIYAGYLGYCTDGHGDIQWLTVYEADCENDGYMIGVCEYCSEIIDEKHIVATGHSYSLTADVPATENTKGMTIYTCDKCGDQYCNYTPATGSTVISETHTVSGSVVLSLNNTATSGKAPAKNVSVVIGGNTVAVTDSNGSFSFELETGSYEAELRYAYGFTRTIYIVVEDTDVEYMNIPIIACDFNKDGKIDDQDYALFNIVISSSANDPSYLDFVDMNNDGYINAKDRLYIKACYGLNAKTFAYPVLIIQK